MSVTQFFETKNMIWLLYGGLMLFLFHKSHGQDFVFPTEMTSMNSGHNDSHNLEVTESHRCPSNMKVYQDDNNTKENFCDCSPGYLYFSPEDSCYAPYERGPCPPRKHLVLPQGETISQCKRNPCNKDELVQFNGTCYELKKSGGPCTTNMTLSVNETNFNLECIDIMFGTRQIITAPMKPCQPGSRRIARGKCRPII